MSLAAHTRDLHTSQQQKWPCVSRLKLPRVGRWSFCGKGLGFLGEGACLQESSVELGRPQGQGCQCRVMDSSSSRLVLSPPGSGRVAVTCLLSGIHSLQRRGVRLTGCVLVHIVPDVSCLQGLVFAMLASVPSESTSNQSML